MKFKEMKFWIGDDQQLFLIVCNILESLGYDNPVTYSMYGNVAITTDKLGRVYAAGGYSENLAAQFHKWGNEEINVDWMRKPAKLETIELNGKSYLKSDLAEKLGTQALLALDEALKHIKPIED